MYCYDFQNKEANFSIINEWKYHFQPLTIFGRFQYWNEFDVMHLFTFCSTFTCAHCSTIQFTCNYLVRAKKKNCGGPILSREIL